MFLALCWIFILRISFFLVQAAEHDECHPWSFYNDTLHHCQCYESVQVFNIRPIELIECSDRKASIYIGYCMTTEELGTSIGYCAAYSLKVNVSAVNGMYIQLPNNISELNDFMCRPMNRKGRVCSECIDGFAPSVISLRYQCANCTGAWYGIPLYLFLELVPITLFYLAVLVFQISLISSPLTTCVMYSQLVAYCCTMNTPTTILKSSHAYTFAEILVMFHGIWNLDFFRSILPPFCVSPNLNNIHVTFLGYISALYPVLLICFTWVSIQLYSRDCQPFVWLWKRLCCLIPNKSTKPKLVDTFATFFFLSYTKVCFISASMFTPSYVLNYRTTEDRSIYAEADSFVTVVYVQPNIRYFSKEHAPYAIIGALVFLVFGLLPALLLAAYPSRRLRSLLCIHRLGGRSNAALNIFMEKFYCCYRDGLDGGRDMRSFASLHLFIRLLTLLVSIRTSPTILFGICCVLVSLAKPCKKSYMHNTDGFILGLLTLHSYILLDLDWYNSFFLWVTYIGAYLPLLIICANLIPLHKLKATVLKFSCCKKLHRFEVDEMEEESAIDDDRDKLLHSVESGLDDSSENN